MSQNLNSEEQAKWKETCKRQRDIARCNPCTCVAMVSCEDFDCEVGPWHLRLTLDAYLNPPQWHGSISLMKEIGDELVYDEKGVPLFEVPKDAMIAVNDWTPEEYDNARDLMGALFGPLINSSDQRVVEARVSMTLQWFTSNKDAQRRIEAVRI